MNKIKRPSRLDIVDMPRDKSNVLGGLRRALCASFNYTSRYPLKFDVLEEVLEYTLKRVKARKEETAVANEKNDAIKRKLDAKAKELGIELDGRKSIGNMKEDLRTAIALQNTTEEEAQAAVIAVAQAAKLAEEEDTDGE